VVERVQRRPPFRPRQTGYPLSVRGQVCGVQSVRETPFSTTVRPQPDTRSPTSRLEVIPRTCRDRPHARADQRIWRPAIRVREPAPAPRRQFRARSGTRRPCRARPALPVDLENPTRRPRKKPYPGRRLRKARTADGRRVMGQIGILRAPALFSRARGVSWRYGRARGEPPRGRSRRREGARRARDIRSMSRKDFTAGIPAPANRPAIVPGLRPCR
jgi:hypothetical protein